MPTPLTNPHVPDAAEFGVPQSLLAGVPRDQALGLRLIAIARAAAAAHMAEHARSELAPSVLHKTQAARLASRPRELAQ